MGMWKSSPSGPRKSDQEIGALAPEVFGMMAKKSNAGSGTIQLKWVRSAICAPTKQKLVIKGLGFTRLNQVIERPDTPAIRGMVAKVPHMIEIVQ